MLFLKIVACLTANKEVLITSSANTDWQLTAKDNNTLRLSFYNIRDSQNITDNNVAVFEKVGSNLYKIKLGLNRYVFSKKSDPGVIAIEDDDPLVGKEGGEGFLWEAIGDGKKVQLKSRNKCLEIRGMDQTNHNKYLNLLPCDNKKLAQDFEILDANIKGKNPKTDEPAKEEGKSPEEQKPEDEPVKEEAKPTEEQKPEEAKPTEEQKPEKAKPTEELSSKKPSDNPKMEAPSGEGSDLEISQPVFKKEDSTVDEYGNYVPRKFRCFSVRRRPIITKKITITNGNS